MSKITIEQFKDRVASEIYENYIVIYDQHKLPKDSVERDDTPSGSVNNSTIPYKKIFTVLNCNENLRINKKNCR